MSERIPAHKLDAQGIETSAEVHWNLTTAPLVEDAVRRGEGQLTKDGALLVDTGKFTGRSVKDKFVVRDATTEETINWGAINQPMTTEHWATLKADFLTALKSQDELYVADLYGGSQPEYRVNVRVITQMAWHNLFVRTLLVRPKASSSSSSLEVRNMTGVAPTVPPSSRTRRSNSIPSICGILISNTARSGGFSANAFSAVAPSE